MKKASIAFKKNQEQLLLLLADAKENMAGT
jgi:hypothetical protein